MCNNFSGLLTQRLIEVQNRDIESCKLVEEFKLKLSQVRYRLHKHTLIRLLLHALLENRNNYS